MDLQTGGGLLSYDNNNNNHVTEWFSNGLYKTNPTPSIHVHLKQPTKNNVRQASSNYIK